MDWFDAPGERISADAVEIEQTREVVQALATYPFAKLVEVRTHTTEIGETETLVIDVEPELPQATVFDIRSPERLCVSYTEGETRYPIVSALRKDFPLVPHLFSTRVDEPRRLCLYEEPWIDVSLTWTGAGFLRYLVEWLSRTAIAELHASDQTLEPVLFESTNTLLFSQEILEDSASEKVFVTELIQNSDGIRSTYRLRELKEGNNSSGRKYYGIATRGFSVPQIPMKHPPRTFKELRSLLGRFGIDLWQVLSVNLYRWYSAETKPRNDDGIIIVIELPRVRTPHAEIESIQRLAFELNPIREIGIASGVVGSADSNSPLRLLFGGGAEVNEDLATYVNVAQVRAIPYLDRNAARELNGLPLEEDVQKVVLVGVGALGSQIHSNLSRMGWGKWTLVDSDNLDPHNVARHRLGQETVGISKVLATELIARVETPYNPVESAYCADAQSVASNGAGALVYQNADLIIDSSTSIAVARFLAGIVESNARRVSVFLNPTGRDAVMLLEDRCRTLTLDALEAQYYRAVLRDEELVDHLEQNPGMRYGLGCRDITTQLAHDDIAVASGLLTRQLRTSEVNAVAAVWQSKDDGSVRRIDIPVYDVCLFERGDWVVVVDHGTIERAEMLRTQHLPKETGGVLIGYFDMPRKRVYVVDCIQAPPDSVQTCESFIRGYAGLREQLVNIEKRCGGQVNYIGEWHSHPDGVGVGMSLDDGKLLGEITEEMRLEGWPGVLMIIGCASRVGLYVQVS
ncbi:MAG: ThiF family adenylyltransferase [Gammaproteobacteria bacterium]|nr:ThiF family adenylyltransferase [Gammaproteobacteria bacterium]